MSYNNRSNDSLCGRSMKMMTNILRSSSLSIASTTLGTTVRSVPIRSHSFAEDSSMMAEKSVVVQSPGTCLSQQPRGRSMPVTYLVELEDGTESAYVLRDDMNVDGRASDYIARVHRKNRHHSHEASENAPIILPPPPRMPRYK
ncbi:hypothetical protein ACJRO7_009535 [Eucalyptus globulus]|uniref:Uncharacterized protein n=1 Tax=Eucalyptus globulus TaxID=34317 RepID=A0ABD3LE25_EUCGL